MPTPPFNALIHLLRAHAGIADRFGRGLGSIHGLGLNEVLLLMHLDRAPLNRLSRVDLAQRLSVSPSTVTRMTAPLEKIGMVREREFSGGNGRALLLYALFNPNSGRIQRQGRTRPT